MSKKQFKDLCRDICSSIGSKKFRPDGDRPDDFLPCGEVRTALATRMLCGGSYLEIVGRNFDVKSLSSVYKYFHQLQCS